MPLAEDSLTAIGELIESLRATVLSELAAQGVAVTAASTRPVLHIRYDGTDTALPVDFTAVSFIGQARQAFEAAHKAQFGFIYDNKPMIVETVGVEGADVSEKGRSEVDSETEDRAAKPSETRRTSRRRMA